MTGFYAFAVSCCSFCIEFHFMTFPTAQYYYDTLLYLAKNVEQAQETGYRLFSELLREATSENRLLFSGNFARLHYLCQQYEIKGEMYARLNSLRARWYRNEKSSEQQWHDDLRTFALFIELLKEEVVPQELLSLLPRHSLSICVPSSRHQKYERVVVTKLNEESCNVVAQDAPSAVERTLYYQGTYNDWTALAPLLSVGTQLNLIAIKERKDGIEAQLIIVEPDHLVDVSSVASCFQAFGVTSALYALQRLNRTTTTRHTLLGNFAAQLLDEAVHETEANYSDSVSRFFCRNALSFATCPEFEKEQVRKEFHREAALQQEHLQTVAHEHFPKELQISPSDVLLEPSFFCEMLGLQGRMDLLTTQLDTLIEQKGGKRNFKGQPQDSHHVQMLLYMAILHYAFEVDYTDLKPYLLYSHYRPSEGLMRILHVAQLLHQAIMIRNEIVLRERTFATKGSADFYETLTPEDFHTLSCGVLWERYKLPEITMQLKCLQEASALEKSYFYRFHRFLSLEQQHSRIGTPDREASGFAAAWHASLDERRQAGNILTPLHLELNENPEADNLAISEVTLLLSTTEEKEETLLLPNFRVGDVVMLYAYEEGELPDLRKGMVHRATIVSIDDVAVRLRLRAPQTNPRVFQQRPRQLWAIEPDYMESGSNALFQGLFAFLQNLPQRRQLLLGEREAETDMHQKRLLTHLNPEIDQLVERALQARDLFLLVGPPGTGKTSVGLMSLVREELARPSHRLLLSAFTNRAVDEICSKLVKDKLPFVRIGNPQGCAEAFRPYLLEQQIAHITQLDDIASYIRSTRIVVGTTASLSTRIELFNIEPFSLGIIDEASQLIEPQLLPLFMAEHREGVPAIARFVLIGDHKQLPAVVQQNERDSIVKDRDLIKIGLTDCRNSLFERFIRCLPPSCLFHLKSHGRMHPGVADFANRHFYANELRPIPLPHQCREGMEPRVRFYDCPPTITSHTSPKTNEAEAQKVLELALQEVKRVESTGRCFDPQKDLGIIVPYRHQIARLRQAFLSSPFPALSQVSIDTVERFQGSERETIIYSFVVSRESQLSFLCNSHFVDERGALIDRKLNVALTRARERTLLVGNAALLRKVPIFEKLIEETSL